jgi:hypothetical protein
MKLPYYEVTADRPGGYVTRRRKTTSIALALKLVDQASKRGWDAIVTHYWGDGPQLVSRQVKTVSAVTKEPF